MIKTLKDTTSAQIQNALIEVRQSLGMTSSTVFTLIAVAGADDYDETFDACVEAGREHPSRIILVGDGSSRSTRLDAELHLGESMPGELIALRFHGELSQHKGSTLLPLLLPDSPVIAWWAGAAPEAPAEDEIGKLAKRRITDAMGSADPLATLRARAASLRPGDIDMTWTRLTAWRALLAAALDQHTDTVTHACVEAAANNAGGLLLAGWLRSRLDAPVDFVVSEGPGVTAVTMATASGDVSVARTDGKMASFSLPDRPTRKVALRRREVSALLAEELRRLDNDPVFSAAMESLVTDFAHAGNGTKEQA
ncbi:glucose-6-phosphate dehydrogenase assembly protein OpcA [Propioniciclava soli]|uniref:Glucose-6-phosphate dehydrogenase assembly protein OpcA n=1 Tax=Propioniciclava soli TaxID=2775081 RepID=A0ABZ3C467_9ACTN